MKKLIAVSILALFVTSSNSFGQDNDKGSQGFKAGIMVSPAICWSNASVDNPNLTKIDNSANPGIAFGLVMDYFFSKNYGFEYYVRYSGFDDHFKYYPSTKNIDSFVDRTLRMQYIEIPVTLKMRTNEVGYMKYFAQIGIAPSVKINARADITPSNSNMLTSSGTNLNITSTDDVNLFMLSSVIGLGAEYNLGGSTNVVASVTWNNAFTNIWHKNTDPSTYSNFNSPVENIALNVGFLF